MTQRKGFPAIGVDFDNTIIAYDALLREEAKRQGYLKNVNGTDKREIRDLVRGLEDGEMKWRRLQAIVYGRRIDEATLADGAEGFLRLCKERHVSVWVISHKTPYAAADPGGVNLREAALRWMQRRGFFGEELGVSPQRIFFSSTRAEKISRIGMLDLTHFVDDLEETFLEDSFPESVEKILYAPHGHREYPGVRVVRSWKEIGRYVFG